MAVNPSSPRSAMDAILMACVSFLICVIAVTIALCLLAKIWYWLLLVGAVLGTGWLLVTWHRWRRQRW